MNSCESSESRALYSHVCSLPWTTLLVDNAGDISFCCYHYPFANINNVSENAMDEIWNGKVAQDLRKRWNEGRLEGTPCGNCVGLKRFKKYEHPAKNMPDGDNPTFSNAQLNLDEFHEGKTILKSMPVEIVYIPSVLCNIRCIFCFQPPIGKDSFIKSKVLLNFYHHLGSRALTNQFSGGESLYLPQTFQLINGFSPDHKAVAEAIFQTNGLLIKDKFQSVTGFRKYGFRISIASFKKETYEYLQNGASFDKLMENLEFLVKCKSEGMDIPMALVMILMKSNFIDLESIFEFAETYKFDEVWVTPVGTAYGQGKILHDENIFRFPDLLDGTPGWKDVLARASEKAMMTDNKLTYYHLDYIQNQLSFSTSKVAKVRRFLRMVVIRFLWVGRRVIVRLLSLTGLRKPARSVHRKFPWMVRRTFADMPWQKKRF